MDKKILTGAIPSIPDDRDRQIENYVACLARLPKKFTTDIPIDIWNQGESNECVACSLSTIKYIQEYNQSNNRDKFSPSYIYGSRDDDMYQGEGMYPREALKILKNYGVIHYEKLPGFYLYPEAKQLCREKKDELFPDAYPFRISSYYAVSGEIQIKNAVYKLNAVSAMFPVYDCLYDVAEDGKVIYTPETSTNNYGYHQMTIVGWTEEDEWIVINSWGDDFGNKGVLFIPFNYPIQEAWAVVDEVLERKYVENPL